MLYYCLLFSIPGCQKVSGQFATECFGCRLFSSLFCYNVFFFSFVNLCPFLIFQVEDPSMLRFLVDLRGENATDTQLRDDLMTMLIAGHETTAALLTWAFFEMAQNPEVVRKAQEEVDSVLGDRVPTLEDIK